MKTIFSEEGDIRSVDILAALVTLWREGSSGALHFSRSGATAGFQLSAGEVTSATSSDARFETAAILMRAGKLENATIERLVTPQGGDRALAALHAGILTKREWRWGEKIRAVEVLSDLLTWIEGDYVFDRGAHAEAGEFRLTVPRLTADKGEGRLPLRIASGCFGPPAGKLAGVGRPEVAALGALQVDQRALIAQ